MSKKKEKERHRSSSGHRPSNQHRLALKQPMSKTVRAHGSSQTRNTVQRTKLCRSELAAYDAMRKCDIPDPSLSTPCSYFTPLRLSRDQLHSGRV
ncbi:hypothetical protein EVAR_86841_1 [Eumeta japonica]|uniref:Uncharacterized protein n=1 Tax=Eumeta variegata TaxID=151549 RepID=A0A4C1VT47_EUMVA|nr:hypothetical protein EVAR_86841_1 [Eumeta japonica]